MKEELQITSLGGLAISKGVKPVTELASRKTMALLLFLAATSRPQPREVLADMFWDDRSQKQAMANLRVVLSSLRKVLGEYVEISRTDVTLKPNAPIFLDVHHLEFALETKDNEKIESALALGQGL